MHGAAWKSGLAERWDALSAVVKIAMVGKYTGLSDAYLSVLKALQHACLAANRKLDVQWVEASHLEPAALVTACFSVPRPCMTADPFLQTTMVPLALCCPGTLLLPRNALAHAALPLPVAAPARAMQCHRRAQCCCFCLGTRVLGLPTG